MGIEELKALCEKYPVYIPIRAAASFLRVSEAGLRCSIDQGRCRFGFSWRLGERSGYKIPTMTFAAWLTNSTIPIEN